MAFRVRTSGLRQKRSVLLVRCLCVAIALVATPLAITPVRADPPAFKPPPWSPRDPAQFDFTVPGVENVPDLHGSPVDADLVIFAGGNQFMVMPDLVRAFTASHPNVKRVFYETLPPGIESEQIARGSLEVGDLVIDVKPDVDMTSLRQIRAEQSAGVVSTFEIYASNRLAIAVFAGNPKHVMSLADLGRDDVRVSMPNPSTEGIAVQIEASYRKAGGEALDRKIMVAKVADGTTILTSIHHRQTPINIGTGRSDAGPVWITEALYQARIGNPIDMVAIPDTQNSTGIYAEAVVKDAPHVANARAFVDFVRSAQGAAIYRSYGFGPPVDAP